MLGEEPALLDVGLPVVGAVHDECRHPDRGQDVPHVDRSVHLEQGERRSGAGTASEVAREAFPAAGVEARGDVGHVHPARPVPLDVLVGSLPLLGRRRPRVVAAPDALGEAAERAQRVRPLRVRRREQDAHVAALRGAEHRRSLRADRVHHGSHVVHPLLERRQVTLRDRIRHPGAALVEEDEARERGEPLEAVDEARKLPRQLDVRHPPRDVHEVGRSLADHLKRDVHPGGLCVARLRRHRTTIASLRVRRACFTV